VPPQSPALLPLLLTFVGESKREEEDDIAHWATKEGEEKKGTEMDMMM